MNIEAYTMDADTYCPDCAKAYLEDMHGAGFPNHAGRKDHHGIPEEIEDGEGNRVFVVFDTSEVVEQDMGCGSCHVLIREGYEKLGFRIDGREYEIAGRKVKANSFELEVTRLSDQFVTDLAICGNPGPAEGQVAFVLANYNITGDAEVCRAILYEYGAWDDEQLEDHQENLRRMVWLIGCEIAKGRHNEMDGFLHFEGGNR